MPSFDTVVIGAGPVGCVAALSFARAGARTLLLEANPQASRRLAGEWLHPPAVRVLHDLGLGLDVAVSNATHGFVVIPDDGTAPVLLSFRDGATGLGCEHHELVARLRAAAVDEPLITFLPSTRVTRVEGQNLTFERKDQSGETTVAATTIAGAYGRAQAGGKWLPRHEERTVLSYMAGLVLEDTTLPFEGFGHLVLGAPGPMLLYRLDEHRIRVCVDIPLSHSSRRQPEHLWHDYGPHFPAELRPAFRAALQARGLLWAANQRSPRLNYGRPGFALVGDAVGHFHPISASGMTLGFLDAECLVHSASFSAYQRERRKRSLVQELLATAVYESFTRTDPGTIAMKHAMYQLWRDEPGERVRTMALLAGDDTSPLHFSRSFLKVMRLAGVQVTRDAVLRRQWRPTLHALRDFGGWLRWLGASTLPRVIAG